MIKVVLGPEGQKGLDGLVMRATRSECLCYSPHKMATQNGYTVHDLQSIVESLLLRTEYRF